MSQSRSIYVYIILALLAYFVGFIMIHNDLWNPFSQAYSSLTESKKTELWGEFFFQSASLALTVLILKYLLAMEPFKDSIKDIFKEIFTEYHFLKDYDKESLLKIAKNIYTVNNDIEFIDKTKDQESVRKLKEYFNNNSEANQNKNYLVIESKYITTLYANGIEIMHRKIKCKIIKDGRFEFKYWFTAPDENTKLDCSTYKDTSTKDRFHETSYNRILKSSVHDDGFELKDSMSNLEENGGKSVLILFSKLHTKVGEILDIEFSISHPFNLSDEKEIENYYNSTYSYPHAIRHIVFQRERYVENTSKIPNISPILYSDNNEIIKGKYTESIYYKTYSWEIFYSQEECETVSMKIE